MATHTAPRIFHLYPCDNNESVPLHNPQLQRLNYQPHTLPLRLLFMATMNQIKICCAECGKEDGVSLKRCNGRKIVNYCSANCQRNLWSKHKKASYCTGQDALYIFKDPPPSKKYFSICFLPMTHVSFLSCITTLTTGNNILNANLQVWDWQMRSWQVRAWNNTIHVAERAFV